MINRFLAAFLVAGGLLLIGCKDDDGPIETAGEAVEDAADEVGDAVEDATDQ
jgi:hypothetical protein